MKEMVALRRQGNRTEPHEGEAGQMARGQVSVQRFLVRGSGLLHPVTLAQDLLTATSYCPLGRNGRGAPLPFSKCSWE